MGSKDFELRMQGMNYAYKIAKEQGIEALGRDIKMRGLTKMQITASLEKVQETWREVVANIYANMLTCFLYSLNETEGFGKKRIKRIKEAYDKYVLNAVDLDYLGEHYVKISDYAKELNDKYNLGIDVSRLDETQRNFDKDDERYHMVKIEKLIEMFERLKMQDTVDVLKRYVEVD